MPRKSRKPAAKAASPQSSARRFSRRKRRKSWRLRRKTIAEIAADHGHAEDRGLAAVLEHVQGQRRRHQVGRRDQAREPREAQAAVGEPGKGRPAQRRRDDAHEQQSQVPEGGRRERSALARFDGGRLLGLRAVVGPHGRRNPAQGARPLLPLVHGRRRLRHRGEEQRLGLRSREARGFSEEQDARMVVDGELLLRAIVREAEGAQGRVGHELGHPVEAQASVEERAVVGDRHGKDRRHARHVSVDAVARDRQPVRVLERVHDLGSLAGRVRVEERQRRAGVAARVVRRDAEGEPVVPGLVAEFLSLRHVRIDPARRLDARVGAAVDRAERERPEKRAAENRDRGSPGQAGPTSANQERGEHDSGQRRERRIGRIEVADRLDDGQPVVEEEEEDVHEQRRQVERAPAHQDDGRPDHRRDGGDPEEDAGPEQHEILDREKRSSGPPTGAPEGTPRPSWKSGSAASGRRSTAGPGGRRRGWVL